MHSALLQGGNIWASFLHMPVAARAGGTVAPVRYSVIPSSEARESAADPGETMRHLQTATTSMTLLYT